MQVSLDNSEMRGEYSVGDKRKACDALLMNCQEVLRKRIENDE
jgi:hypothetical protein